MLTKNTLFYKNNYHSYIVYFVKLYKFYGNLIPTHSKILSNPLETGYFHNKNVSFAHGTLTHLYKSTKETLLQDFEEVFPWYQHNQIDNHTLLCYPSRKD